MAETDSTQNTNIIDNVKNDIMIIEKELNYTLNTIDILRDKLKKKREYLLNICPHTNKIKKREDGPYGELYWYYNICNLEF